MDELKEEIEKNITNYYDDESNGNLSVRDVVIFPIKRKVKGVPDYVMVFQDVINATIAKTLKPATCKLLLFMFTKLEYSNHVGINVETFQEELGYSKMTVISSINELRKYNIIISYKDGNDKRRNIYILHPKECWKGSFPERFRTMNKLDQNQLKLQMDEK